MCIEAEQIYPSLRRKLTEFYNYEKPMGKPHLSKRLGLQQQHRYS